MTFTGEPSIPASEQIRAYKGRGSSIALALQIPYRPVVIGWHLSPLFCVTMVVWHTFWYKVECMHNTRSAKQIHISNWKPTAGDNFHEVIAGLSSADRRRAVLPQSDVFRPVGLRRVRGSPPGGADGNQVEEKGDGEQDGGNLRKQRTSLDGTHDYPIKSKSMNLWTVLIDLIVCGYNSRHSSSNLHCCRQVWNRQKMLE